MGIEKVRFIVGWEDMVKAAVIVRKNVSQSQGCVDFKTGEYRFVQHCELYQEYKFSKLAKKIKYGWCVC